MKYVYASRMGKTEKLIGKLALDAMKIENGTETAEGDYIIFTYTDGNVSYRTSWKAFWKTTPIA